LLPHGVSLMENGDQHPEIKECNYTGEDDIAFKPPVRGLWHDLDSFSPAARIALLLLGIGGGSCLLAWGVYGTSGKRFSAGLAAGLVLFVFGWNVFFDWLLRSN
jgi:hypothetical protein